MDKNSKTNNDNTKLSSDLSVQGVVNENLKKELNETRTYLQNEINDLVEKNGQCTIEVHDTKMQLVEQLKVIKELNEDHNLELNQMKEEHSKEVAEKEFAHLEKQRQQQQDAENKLYERTQQMQDASDLKVAEVMENRDRMVDELNR